MRISSSIDQPLLIAKLTQILGEHPSGRWSARTLRIGLDGYGDVSVLIDFEGCIPKNFQKNQSDKLVFNAQFQISDISIFKKIDPICQGSISIEGERMILEMGLHSYMIEFKDIQYYKFFALDNMGLVESEF